MNEIERELSSEQSERSGRKALRTGVTFFAVIFGIVLPAISLSIELLTHFSAGIFVDPLPTWIHIAIVASVPIINLYLLMVVSVRNSEFPRTAGWCGGFAIGVSLVYSLIYIPLTPIAFIAIIFFGIGLLPLSPLFSCITTIILRDRFRKIAGRPLPGLWRGMMIAVLVFVLAELPDAITLTGMHMAKSPDAEMRLRGIGMLRRFGNTELLLTSCYLRGSRVPSVTAFMINAIAKPISPDVARDLYYRVTGTPFNAVAPPENLSAQRSAVWGADFDFAQGGDAVEARVRGLSLDESRIDGSVDANGLVSYTEWTQVFRNDSSGQREARAQIALPPGGVISRLTLWINGEPREAAFGGRSQVRQAYQKVVRRRRDPVLVTTSGPDQVLVQCFPVPPNGNMKIRLGITAPLALKSTTKAGLRLPYFIEHNFTIPPTLEHTAWVESPQRLSVRNDKGAMTTETTEQGITAVRGELKEHMLQDVFVIWGHRDRDIAQSWAADAHSADEAIVTQVIKTQPTTVPERVVFVLDGSRRMNHYSADISSAIRAIPVGTEFGVILAGDVVEEVSPLQPASPEILSEISSRIQRLEYVGGCDNVPALAMAWEWAEPKPNSIIVWLHATQPVELQRVESLRQKWARRPGNPRLYDMQFGSGPNRVTAGLADACPLIRVPRLGSVQHDLTRLLDRWSGTRSEHTLLRTKQPTSANDHAGQGHKTSDHLVRLWAYDEILRLVAEGTESSREAAMRLATSHQLVTPVSGAVVLESQQQYDEANLKPVAKDSVPTIPEPEAWALIIIAAIVFISVIARERRTRASIALSSTRI